jgi:hypothetical protein
MNDTVATFELQEVLWRIKKGVPIMCYDQSEELVDEDDSRRHRPERSALNNKEKRLASVGVYRGVMTDARSARRNRMYSTHKSQRPLDRMPVDVVSGEQN